MTAAREADHPLQRYETCRRSPWDALALRPRVHDRSIKPPRDLNLLSTYRRQQGETDDDSHGLVLPRPTKGTFRNDRAVNRKTSIAVARGALMWHQIRSTER